MKIKRSVKDQLSPKNTKWVTKIVDIYLFYHLVWLWFYYVYRHFQQYFSYIVFLVEKPAYQEKHRPIAISFIIGRRQTKPRTCRNSWTDFITYCYIEYTSPRAGFKLPTLVVISTDHDCTGSCKVNYHTIMTTTAPRTLNEWRRKLTYIHFIICKIWYNFVCWWS
jgi:hypothetical protein